MATYYQDESLSHGYSTALVGHESVNGIDYTISHGATNHSGARQAVTSMGASGQLPSLVLRGHVEVGKHGVCVLYWTKLLEIGGPAGMRAALKALADSARAGGAREALEKVRIALGIDS